jgi:3-isopropylmalate/(R)-2-methylmalate dehydratase large subunit
VGGPRQCGALGALAIPVGAIDMVCAWMSGEVRLTVPPTCRVRLDGELPPGATARDIVLHLRQLPYLRDGRAAGQVIEFSGGALLALPTVERALLTGMAGGVGALCGIVAPDAGTLAFLRERRGLAMALDPWMRSDPDAEFAHTIGVDCSALASGRQVAVDERRYLGGERTGHGMGATGDHMQPGGGQQAGEALADRHRADRIGVAP